MLMMVLLALLFGDVSVAADVPPSAAIDSLHRHDPYDLSRVGQPADTTDVYRSSSDNLLQIPRFVLTLLAYLLGELTIQAERGELISQYYHFFVNASGTFGILPQVQFGGETGAGGGLRAFHTDLWGSGKQLDAFFNYSGRKGRTLGAEYTDPTFLHPHLYWKSTGLYLRTRNEDTSINKALDDIPGRRFLIDQTDVRSRLGWRVHAGSLAKFRRNLYVEATVGYGRRDFAVHAGDDGPLTDS
jgi:hypothetical protein